MASMPPVLADFSRYVEALRVTVVCFTEESSTDNELGLTADLAELLKICERMETGLHLLHMRGAKPIDIEGHLQSANAGDVIWGD